MFVTRIYDQVESVNFDTSSSFDSETANISADQSLSSFQAQSTSTSNQKPNDETPRRTKFATVFADGKAKRYSTRRSSAWKAVSRRITTFQGSGYMDFGK